MKSTTIDLIPPADEDFRIPHPTKQLLHFLREQEIRYCYWKSSSRLRRALQGAGDLDLLVCHEDKERLTSAILRAQFKRCRSASSRNDPSTEEFLGFDSENGSFLRLHVHHELIAGPALLKAYRLPWERQVLLNAVWHPVWPIRILDPETEAILLLVRRHLDLTWSDLVARRRWPQLKERYADEARRLADQIDVDRLGARIEELFGASFCSSAGFMTALNGAHPREFRRSLIKWLAPWHRHGRVEHYMRLTARTVNWVLGGLNRTVFHFPRAWNRQPASGGAIVAVIGVDGSGKSSVVRHLQMLSEHIDVFPIYFGTGDGRPSWFFLPLKLAMTAITPLVSKPAEASHGKPRVKTPSIGYRIGMSIWALALSLEKRRKLASAWKAANRGLLVITDRYPQCEIPGFNDGPLLDHRGLKWSWLQRWEGRAYQAASRRRPDLVIHLDVDLATAMKREPLMRPEVACLRIEQVRRLTLNGAPLLRLDARRPFEDVILQARRAVFELL